MAKELKPCPAFGAYEDLIEPLRIVARSLGYALAVHGSLTRDVDLIAAPWTDDACDATSLAEAIRAEAERITGRTAFWMNDDTAQIGDWTRRNPEPKPHGRLGWSIHIAGAGMYVDLSVLPRQPSNEIT
jgi:hypothetical protein